MNSIERFYATVEYRLVDRPAAWLGIPDIHAQQALFRQYGVSSLHELKLAVGDDFYAVEIPYNSPDSNAIYAAFNWYGDSKVDAEHRTLTADGCFRDAETPEDLKGFSWPDPALYIDPEKCRQLAEQAPADKVLLGVAWSSHFQDTCAAFGMQTALINMIANPELYEAVNEKILEFYLKANEIFYQAVKGRLHAVLIGNDMGSQRGLMLSPELIRRFVMPGCRRLVEQAHRYDLKVIYHSCGSIAEIIPDLIDAGVDIIHPIQAKAAGMQPELLKERFYGKAAFCGGIDTQELLVHGSPQEVRKRVREIREMFPTGLIVSPSHEAILPDVPACNIQALFDETKRRTIKRIGEMIAILPEKLEEYIRYHSEPWPEIDAMIYACNIRNYTIFQQNGFLFAYYEYIGEDFDADMARMASDPKTQEWWSLVKPLQQPLANRKDGEWWSSMEEVYHLEK